MTRGLVVDFGGVLTNSVTASFKAFCAEVGVASDLVKQVFTEAYEAGKTDPSSPIHLLETGQLSADEFAVGLATALRERTGVDVPAAGLVRRLFASTELDEVMLGAVAAARAAGVRTCLLSNSWGDDGYPRERFPALFDAVVISGEVGLRKPDPAIYALAAERLGLPPSACVFVDDIDSNVEAAEAAGMTAILHRDAAETLPRLAELLDLEPEQLQVVS